VSEPRLDAIVVGGGVAGLVAARALAQRGRSFVLLEASGRWGGVVHTEREAGFVLDGGPDSVLAQKPEAAALCRALGLGERLVPTNPDARTVYVLHGRRLHPMPDGMVLGVPTRLWPLAVSGLFTVGGKLRMAMEPFVPRRTSDVDESIADFVERRLGRQAVERLGEPLLGGIHAGDPRQLSVQATFPRLLELERKHGSLVRGMREAARTSRGAAFLSLAGGMGELVDALAASVPASSRRLSVPVEAIRRDGGDFVVSERESAWRGRALILAVPAHRAAPMLRAFVPAAAAALATIRFASTATVLMGFRRHDLAHPLDGYGLVVPRTEGRRTLACTFVSTKLPGRAPEGHVLLRGFLGGVHDPAVVERDDLTLRQHFFDEMAPVLGLRGAPLFARVFRWPQATPQMEVGHRGRVAAAEAALAAVPGLYATSGGFRGAGLPDVIGDAERTAEAAAAYVASLDAR
jgi:oxygen-dependent protoporphyrinogen oxidase